MNKLVTIKYEDLYDLVKYNLQYSDYDEAEPTSKEIEDEIDSYIIKMTSIVN